MKHYDEALSVYHQVLALAGLSSIDKAYALNSIGVVLEEQDELEDALEHYQAAHEADPKNAVYLINQGNVLRQLKRYAKALFVYNQALALADLSLIDKPSALYGIGLVLDDQEKLEEALKLYQEAHKTDPKNARYLNSQGNVIGRLKRYDEALFVYNQASAFADLSLIDRASALNGIGVVLEAQGKLEAALKQYQAAHGADPKEARYLTNQGTVLRCLKHYDEALSVYKQTLALADLSFIDRAIALNGIAVVLGCQEKIDGVLESLKYYQMAHEADPKNALCLINQGNSLHYLKRYDEALSVYKQTLALADLSFVDKAFALNGIGDVLKTQEKLDDALKYYQMAHEADPSNAQYWINEAKLLKRRNNYKEAKSVLKEAEKLVDQGLFKSSDKVKLIDVRNSIEKGKVCCIF